MQPARFWLWLSLIASFAHGETVRVLATGNASSDCSLSFLGRLLELPPKGVTFNTTELGIGVLRDGNRFLFSEHSLASPLAAVEASLQQHDGGTEFTVFESEEGYLVQWPAGKPVDFVSELFARYQGPQRDSTWFGPPTASTATLARLDAGTEQVLALTLPKMREVGREMVPGLMVTARIGNQSARLYAICKIRGEPTRVVRALTATRANTDLALSIGNMVSSAPRDQPLGKASAEAQLRAALALNFNAILPSHDELAGGLNALNALADAGLPFVATNLVYDEGPNANQPVLPAFKMVTAHGKKILVLGLVGDGAFQKVHPSLFPNVRLKAFDRAQLKDAVAEAHTLLGQRPDAIVLLMNTSEISDGRWFSEAHDLKVDVLIASFEGVGASKQRFERSPKTVSDRQLLASVVGSRHGYSLLEFEFGNLDGPTSLLGVTHEVIRIGESEMPDLELQKRLFDTELAQLEAGKDDLMPSPEELLNEDASLESVLKNDGQPLWYSRPFRQLMAHLMREASGAELAAVHAFHSRVNAGGRFSAALLDQVVGDTSRIATVTLTGAQLETLGVLGQLEAHPLTFANFDAAKRLVGGRSLQGTQRYRVALPESLFGTPAFTRLLEGIPVHFGERLSALLVKRLRPLRDNHRGMTREYAAQIAQRLKPHLESEALWSLSVERLQGIYQLNYASFPAETTPFGQIPEQRVKSPTFHFMSVKGSAWLTRDSEVFTWRTGATLRFQRTFFPSLDERLPLAQRELEDSLVPQTELRFKLLRLSSGKDAYDFIPYVKASFDTEFTPNEAQRSDGRQVLPHRAFLSGTAGVGLFPNMVLKELRAGVVTQGNLTKPSGNKVQVGAEAGVKLAKPLNKNITWILEGAATYFPPAGETDPAPDGSGRDDRDVLGLRLNATTALMVSLFEWLSGGVTVDYLGFAGKTPSTALMGHNLQVGLTLAIDTVWKPQYAQVR